jgi:hypothetical protein
LRSAHLEAAEAGQLDRLTRRHEHRQGFAISTPCFKGRHDGLDVFLYEQHVGHNDVGLADVFFAGREGRRVGVPIGCRVK